ncbi:MAG: histidine phosphatase family protein [Bacteroidota bacterium]
MENHKLLYILRHGETEYNRKKMVQGSGVDSSLNETGQKQAAAFFKKYGDIPFELLITSKLKRTHETMSPFIQTGLPWLQMSEINEISWGDHEGKKSTPDMIEKYMEVVNAWNSGQYNVSLANGESALELGTRMQKFVEHIKARPEKKILVCSHGRAMRAMMAVLQNLPLSTMDNFHHTNTGLYLVRFTGQDFLFEKENDVSHLDVF